MSEWQPNALEQRRLDKADALREAGMHPYPRRIERTHTTAEAIGQWETAEQNMAEGDEIPEITATVCGRLISFRDL